MTAAQMKKMMEAVVLDGTARRAILDGYTIGGKTGTAQKVDPKTGAYSKTKYVASFVGFAPVNNPAITIAVILDSAQGLHQGGQVSAPVFRRIAQQALEYMHVPHDIEPKNQQRFTLLAASTNDDTAEEGSDHLGAPVLPDNDENPGDVAGEKKAATSIPLNSSPKNGGHLVNVAATASGPLGQVPPDIPVSDSPQVLPGPLEGTVVLNVDSGVIVPSFVGKSVRSAVEFAQQSGLEINVTGSGIARQQSPEPGAHLLAGQRVTVRFSH